MTKSDIVREFLDKDKYFKMPRKKLGRIIYNKHPEAFDDAENARKILQYVEGKNGEQSKETVKGTKYVREEALPFNPYNLPKSDAETYKPYFIRGHKRGLIINDIHLPYHSIEAITAVFKFAKKEKPDFILINGDLLDFHQLSYFMRDPRKKRFSEELAMFKKFFETLQSLFPAAKIYFKFGNHEERYDNYLYQKAGELKGVKEFELEEIIKARA